MGKQTDIDGGNQGRTLSSGGDISGAKVADGGELGLLGNDGTTAELEAVAELVWTRGWGVEDGLSVGANKLGGGLVVLDELGGGGEGGGDRIIELGQFAQGQGLVAGGGENLRSQGWGCDLLIGEGLGGEKGDFEGRSPAAEFDEGRIDAINGGATHQTNDANGSLGVRYDQIWAVLRHGSRLTIQVLAYLPCSPIFYRLRFTN